MEQYSPSSSSGLYTRNSDEESVILAADRPKKRAGRKKFKETRHPVYRGVRRRNSDKWVCELREPTKQKRVWLGTYPTPEMAARAHDLATLALRGPTACLNFADSVWRLPVPASKDAKELRKAAAAAAEAFWPRDSDGFVDCGPSVHEQEVHVTHTPVSVCGAQRHHHMLDLGMCSFEKFDSDNVVSSYEDLSMAELAAGVLMSPPPRLGGWSFCWDHEVESEAEVELWSF